MKKLFVLTVTTFISFATYAKEDSLIAKIGKKAKVVFYTDTPEDLKEISKYDLNLLFKELKKRSEKNFLLSEEVTLKEADELKNREANTTVTPKKWFKNMNLNLFTGMTLASVHRYRAARLGDLYKAHFMGPVYRCGNGLTYANLFDIGSEPSVMFGIGGYFDKTLQVKNRKTFSLRYGFGLEFVTTKMTITQIDSILIRNPLTSQYSSATPGLGQPERKVHSNNIYTEIQPTIHFLNNKGQKNFRFGLGLKLAISLNNLDKEKIVKNFLYEVSSPYLGIKNKPIQTSLTASLSYKYINLFFQITPNNIQVADLSNSSYTVYLPVDSPRQINGTNYILGLRFGK